MDQTRLEFGDWRGKMMYAVNVSRLTVRDLHLTRSSPGTTQGFVTRVQPGKVTVAIPAGFPLPSQLFNSGYENSTRSRTYLRRYHPVLD